MTKQKLDKQLSKIADEKANTATELAHIDQRLAEIAIALPGALRRLDTLGDKAAEAEAKALRTERLQLEQQRAMLEAQMAEYPSRLQSIHDEIARLEYDSDLANLAEMRKTTVEALRSYEAALWPLVDAHAVLVAAIDEHDRFQRSIDKRADRLGLPSAPNGLPGIWPKPDPAFFGGQREPAQEAKERFRRLWSIVSQQVQFKDM